jgi:hypothetical protein
MPELPPGQCRRRTVLTLVELHLQTYGVDRVALLCVQLARLWPTAWDLSHLGSGIWRNRQRQVATIMRPRALCPVCRELRVAILDVTLKMVQIVEVLSAEQCHCPSIDGE